MNPIESDILMLTIFMASKSQLTPPPQWWKHLREWKRVFWKKERQNAKREIRDLTLPHY